MDLPTYTNIWRIEKRLYKLYDLRLPMPLPIVWIGVFVGVFVPWSLLLILIGVPVAMPWHVLFLVPPGIVTWLSTRPVIEGKRLTELLESHMRYLGEPKAWYRLAPTAEPETVTFSVRVWRVSPARVRSRRPAKSRHPVRRRETQPAAGPRQVRPAVAAAAAAAGHAPVAEPPARTGWGARRGAAAPALKTRVREGAASGAPAGPVRREEGLTGRPGRHDDLPPVALPGADPRGATTPPPPGPRHDDDRGGGDGGRKGGVRWGSRKKGGSRRLSAREDAIREAAAQQAALREASAQQAAAHRAAAHREAAAQSDAPGLREAADHREAAGPREAAAQREAADRREAAARREAAIREAALRGPGSRDGGQHPGAHEPVSRTRPAHALPEPGDQVASRETADQEPGSRARTGSELAAEELAVREAGAAPADAPGQADAARGTVVPIRTAQSRKPAAGKPIDTEALRRLRRLAASADAPAETVGRTDATRPADRDRREDEAARDQHRKGQPPRLGPALPMSGRPGLWPPLNPDAKPAPRLAPPRPPHQDPAPLDDGGATCLDDEESAEHGVAARPENGQAARPGQGQAARPGQGEAAGPGEGEAARAGDPGAASSGGRETAVPGHREAPGSRPQEAVRLDPHGPTDLAGPGGTPAAGEAGAPTSPAAVRVPSEEPAREQVTDAREQVTDDRGVATPGRSGDRPRRLTPVPTDERTGPDRRTAGEAGRDGVAEGRRHVHGGGEFVAPVAVPRPGEGKVRRVESVVGRDSGGWRRIAQVVVGGNGVRTDGSEIDEARARAVFGGSRRIVVLGCTGGAGQSTTALMLGHTLAQYRDDRVVAVDANTGGTTLTSKIQLETPETLTSLLSGLDRVSGYLTMRGYTTRTSSGLEVISADTDAGAEQRLADRSFFSDHRLGESMRLLDRHYKLAVIDPAAALAARVLPYADQLVLVVPASEEASEAVAMTYEWLDGHGCAELRRRAVMVVNGVSRRSMADVEQAESVARGRCRAIVRVPWEDGLAPGGAEVVDPGLLRAAGRRAYLALAGVVVAGFAAQSVRPSEEELASDPPGTRIGER
ncbi:MAG TPA: TcpE family conjugal transfer membrane protein [Nonomuraea sp.]|nr:TcpE family conjugal transfer membrane protein [Nonomuraea sp.]